VKNALVNTVTDENWTFYRADKVIKPQEIKKFIVDDEF
jgi:hypothetical protein